jgi:hypothetical protein
MSLRSSGLRVALIGAVLVALAGLIAPAHAALCPPLGWQPPADRGAVLCGYWWHKTRCPYGCPVEFRNRK